MTQGQIGKHAVQVGMAKQAALVGCPQFGGQFHASIGRIADHQIEPVLRFVSRQAVAYLYDRLQSHVRPVAQFDQGRVQEDLRHPCREGIKFKPGQTALDVRQHRCRRPTPLGFDHASGHRRKERASPARRIEHPRRTPVDSGRLGQIQQPFTQCRRCVVRTVGRPEPFRQQPCVNAPNRIAGLCRIQLGGRQPNGSGKAIDRRFMWADDIKVGRNPPQFIQAMEDSAQAAPVVADYCRDDCPRAGNALFGFNRLDAPPDRRQSLYDIRVNQSGYNHCHRRPHAPCLGLENRTVGWFNVEGLPSLTLNPSMHHRHRVCFARSSKYAFLHPPITECCTDRTRFHFR